MITDILIKGTALVWSVGGMLHWLVIFGVFKEPVPKPIEVLFRLSAVLNFVIAYGLWNHLEWARVLCVYFIALHLFAHSWLIFYSMKNKLKIEKFRFLEVAMAIFCLVFFNLSISRAVFH